CSDSIVFTYFCFFFFFSSRRRHTRCYRDWSSDVCSSDLVAPLERFDVPPVRPEQGFAPCGAVVADDDAFPAAQVEPRHRGLVGHAARQPEGVDQRGAIALVVPEARAAQRRPEHRGMNRDDAAIAGGWIVI